MSSTPQHRRSTRTRSAPKRYEDENFVSGRYDRYVQNYNGRNRENTFLAKLEDKDNTYFRPITEEDEDFIVKTEENNESHLLMYCKQRIEESDEEEWYSDDETEVDEEWIASADEDEDAEGGDEEFEHYGHLSDQARKFMIEEERQQQQDNSDLTEDEEIKNLCTECGVNMGPSNPRQLCGKTYCTND